MRLSNRFLSPLLAFVAVGLMGSSCPTPTNYNMTGKGLSGQSGKTMVWAVKSGSTTTPPLVSADEAQLSAGVAVVAKGSSTIDASGTFKITAALNNGTKYRVLYAVVANATTAVQASDEQGEFDLTASSNTDVSFTHTKKDVTTELNAALKASVSSKVALTINGQVDAALSGKSVDWAIKDGSALVASSKDKKTAVQADGKFVVSGQVDANKSYTFLYGVRTGDLLGATDVGGKGSINVTAAATTATAPTVGKLDASVFAELTAAIK